MRIDGYTKEQIFCEEAEDEHQAIQRKLKKPTVLWRMIRKRLLKL